MSRPRHRLSHLPRPCVRTITDGGTVTRSRIRKNKLPKGVAKYHAAYYNPRMAQKPLPVTAIRMRPSTMIRLRAIKRRAKLPTMDATLVMLMENGADKRDAGLVGPALVRAQKE